MKLIIQIPCYNEEDTLKYTLADLPRELPGVDSIEYLVINDGSTDHTVETAQKYGVEHILNLRNNKGLAKCFMAGLDESLRLGADIIVNTDADNQYCGADIEKLIRPILEEKADIVIGERPIFEIPQFSVIKKILQRLGSWVVRKASRTDIPDAPSGFRAFSREAAMKLSVINEYTYTLETIVQAGREKLAITSVPIRINPELRKSRLFKNIWSYVEKSMLAIFRAYMMYRSLICFSILAIFPTGVGIAIGIRFLLFFANGEGRGHVQSLILACTLIIIGFLTFMIGLLSDLIAANRKILQDVQARLKEIQYCTGENPSQTEKRDEIRDI